MKRSDFRKALSVVLVVAMLLMSTTSAFAAVSANQDATSTKVTVSGTIEGAPEYSSVTLIVVKGTATEAEIKAWEQTGGAWSSDKFIAADSAIVGKNGSFTHTFTLPSTLAADEYMVIASTTNDGVAFEDRKSDFIFVAPDDRLAALREVVAQTDSATLAVKIENNKIKLNIDIDKWDAIHVTPTPDPEVPVPTNPPFEASELQVKSAAAIAVNAAMTALRAKGISNLTIEDLPAATDAINKEIYAQFVGGGVAANIDNIQDYISADDYYKFVADGKITATGNSKIAEALIGTPVNNIGELEDSYKKNLLVFGVTNPKDNNGVISKEMIENLGEDAGLTAMAAYNGLTDYQKQLVADACKSSNATTFAELDGVFNENVAKYASVVPVVTPKPGGGNGSGGGGSTTTVVTPTATPTPTAEPSDRKYTDIENHQWAWEAIDALSDRNIFNGYGDNTFRPDNAILREEFIKIAVVGTLGEKAVDMSAVPSYSDAQSGWFAPYVAAAEKNKITSGIGDGMFGTGMEITRQDMAVMLYRMIVDAGISIKTDAYAFTDAGSIADYAKDAVYALKNMGIISGNPDGSFNPEGATTRAEAAVLLYKTLDAMGKILR